MAEKLGIPSGIPYLAADHACYAFQVADYAKQFTCISVDPRGASETDKPEGIVYRRHRRLHAGDWRRASTCERFVTGAATGLWLAGKYP
jgi:hypothetical protein